MTPSDKKILDWIDNYQKGKGGIYPHHVAVEVCVQFKTTMSEAKELVLQHIKEVLNHNA